MENQYNLDKACIAALASEAEREITKICHTFGPRPCGEAGETDAQKYLLDKLAAYGEARRETFTVHPDAFMSFVPLAGVSLMAAGACNAIAALKNKKFALGAIAGMGTAVAGIVGEFGLYKEMLDPCFKEKTSGNVICVRPAAGETKRRIIISGHTDSAPEWTYTYELGSKGVLTVAGYGIAGLAYTVVQTIVNLVSRNKSLKRKLMLGQTLFLPAYGLLLRFTDSKNYVPGASDDLSGVMVAASVMQYLQSHEITFENTEVIALLTGGEECGLRGAKAFFKAHPEMKDDGVETVFLGFDTIRDEAYMTIYEGDMSGVVKNDRGACEFLQRCASDCGCDVPIGTIPLGSTDAAAASQAGIRAASFVAMDPAPARYYHTRLDTPENLIPETIAKGIEIALTAVFDYDAKGI